MNAVDLLEKLVSFPTVSRDSNLPLIEFVEGYLAEQGVSTVRVPNDSGTKANLYATIGPQVEGGVVLSGHTDVVPVEGQPWTSDPFSLTKRGTRYYGRGTCDMKAFLALALALVPEMKPLKKPIHLALSYDEEIGCLGAPRMIEELRSQISTPQAVIVGEPSLMQAVTAHKGIAAFRTTVTGHEAHSSLVNQGVSAVMNAARLINWLSERGERFRSETSTSTGFDPHHTTVHVGTVRGGTAVNIISRHCEFVWDVRTVPENTAQEVLAEFEQYCSREVLPKMQNIHAGTSIRTEILADTPPLQEDPDSPATQLALQLTGRTHTSRVAYAAEAGQFQQAGFPAVICGPGSIEQAHQPDEFIEEDQLVAGEAFLRQLITTLS